MSETERPLKILVSGDVEGKLNDLYSRVKSIQSKVGKFDLLFCVGEFFAENDEDNKEIEEYFSNPSSIPIQTYVLGPNHSSRYKYFYDKSGCDLCDDKIIYLGPKGSYSTVNGLNIVYLSGVENKREESNKRFKRSDESEPEELVEFDLKDIESIINNYEKRNPGECLDILLTNQWPKYIENLSNQKLDNDLKTDNFGSELISHLAVKLKPRYHFSASENFFFERIPYRNHQVLLEKEKHMTRFLALAKVNKSNKPKFLYAFNITPAKKMDYIELVRQTANPISSDNPFVSSLNLKNNDGSKYYAEHDVQPSLQYFYDAEYIEKMNREAEREMEKQKRKLEAMQKSEQEPCWFCLGGSKIERQYIVSVGDKCYLAYAKGAINKDNLLIIPIEHVQSTVQADVDLLNEITKFKVALTNYFRSKNKCVLFYERNFRTKHMQIQVYAIRADKSYLLKDAFLSMAGDQNVYLNEIPEMTNLKQILQPNQPYYYLELPKEETETKSKDVLSMERFLCEIRGGFPINFGRDVMASELLLNCTDRIDWKECVLSPEEEKKIFKSDQSKYVILSSSINDLQTHFYTFYLPIVCIAWRNLNYEPIVFLVSSDYSNNNPLVKISVKYLERLGVKIIKVDSVKSYELTTSKLSRLFSGLLDYKLIMDNDYVITSDSDLIPIKKEYYQVRNFDDITVWNSECCGYFTHKNESIKMYPVSHIGMKKSNWKKVMNLDESIQFDLKKINSKLVLNKVMEVFKDVNLIRQNFLARDANIWFLDQKMISYMIKKFINENINVKISEIEFNGTRLDRKYDSNMKIWKEKTSEIIDFHLYHEDLKFKWSELEDFINILFSDFKSDKVLILNYLTEYRKIYYEIN
ncbi:unnamed protein product [Brachionus calyciflorus]|uniref:Cwf19-like C-terminal domain-containing protein n=1 Tax=Brachionus calyciflorus TaxID=104777 RepID=A0A813Q1V0_9BILA|nr:unnamed protein product [Brachionus calyciflorus]